MASANTVTGIAAVKDVAPLKFGASVAANGATITDTVLDEAAIRLAPHLDLPSVEAGDPAPSSPSHGALYSVDDTRLSSQSSVNHLLDVAAPAVSASVLDQLRGGGELRSDLLTDSIGNGLRLSGLASHDLQTQVGAGVAGVGQLRLPGVGLDVIQGARLSGSATSGLDGFVGSPATSLFDGLHLSGDVAIDRLLDANAGPLGAYAVDGFRVSGGTDNAASVESILRDLQAGFYAADTFRASGGTVLEGLAGAQAGGRGLALVDSLRTSGQIGQNLFGLVSQEGLSGSAVYDRGDLLASLLGQGVVGTSDGSSERYLVDSLRLSQQLSDELAAGSHADGSQGTLGLPLAGDLGDTTSAATSAGRLYQGDLARLSGQLSTSILRGIVRR